MFGFIGRVGWDEKGGREKSPFVSEDYHEAVS